MRSPSGREHAGAGAGAVALAAAVLAAVVLAVPAAAGQEADEGGGVGLAVEVGYAGHTGGAAWMPVTVTVQPNRLVAGTLTVESRTPGGGVREERDIEVSVGSRNAYRFVVPGGVVTASVTEGGNEPVTVRGPPRQDGGGDFLVGTLGALPSSPPPLRSEPLAASGGWVSVDPQWVELSPGALEPLSGLVANGRALAGLSATGQRNLMSAVAAGLDLVIVAPVPDDLAVPWDLDAAAWTLPADDVTGDAGAGQAAATVVAAGRGRVATTEAVLGEGPLGSSPALWSALIEPRPSVADGMGDVGMGGRLGPVLGVGSTGVPTLPWLAVFLVVYIVVVGPVNGAVLARLGRRELAWVTVPVVTAVFTAGGWLGAQGSQPPVGFAGSATAWVDGAASESLVAVGRSPTPGQRRITLPGDEWDVLPEGTGEPVAVQRAGDLRVTMDLAALQPGGVVARRAVDTAPPLRVEATGSDDGLQVSVTNVASEPIADVEVRAATESSHVGDLQPGETRNVTVEAERLPVDDWGGRGQPMGMPGSAPEGPAALAWVLGEVLDGNPGLVWAVGTAGTSATGATVDGRRPADLGRYVAVGVRAAGTPRVHTVDRELMDAGQDAFRPAPLIVEGGGPAVLRYRIPPAGAGATLRASLDRNEVAPPGRPAPALWLWERRERQWRPLADALPDGRGGPDGYVSSLGEVYVRATGPLVPLSLSGMGLTVEEAQ